LLQVVRGLTAGQEPPHIVRSPAANDLRHIACIVTKIPASQDPKEYIAEVLKAERYWEAVHGKRGAA
jgi:hypothetical protein